MLSFTSSDEEDEVGSAEVYAPTATRNGEGVVDDGNDIGGEYDSC